MSQIESSKKIYGQLQSVINDLVEKLSSDSHGVTTQKETKLGRDVLSKLHEQINEQLTNLDKHAEWDTYTIALYGETNAGKSTIIETLRILFDEEHKLQQQLEFKEWQKNSGVSTETIEEVRNQILAAEGELDQEQSLLRDLASDLQLAISKRESDLKDKGQLWEELKKSASLFQRLCWLFKPAPEYRDYKDSETHLDRAKTDLEKKTQQNVDSIDAMTQKVSGYRAKHDQLIEQINQAEPFADGAIIGNGRSDFTLETQSYTFERDGFKFNLLDVPGIEGKESKVSGAIWEAVHKAHTVFYITGKASAPQKGDGKNPGTLDKIKEHLGAQSEVWTVFNKRVQNPIQIKNRDLISQGEEESLQVLDSTMKQYLGDSYQSHLAVSAYPAFLAASSCLLPASRDEKNKEKFLSQMPKQELLDKSNINVIAEMFNQTTVSTFKEKIARSNKKKAREVVGQARNCVKELLGQKFAPLLEELEGELGHTSGELNSLVASLRARLHNQTNQEIRKFEEDVRKSTYYEIDKDISNDQFKRVLESSVQRSQEALIERLPIVMEKELKQFEQRLTDTINRFQAQTSDVMGSYSSLSDIDTNIEVNLDSGVNVWGVLGAVGGGLALFWTPVGWGLIAVSAATLIFQFYKAIRSMFSSSYKKSQQRKSTNENIDKISTDIKYNIEQAISEALTEVEINVEKIRDAMSLSIQHIRDVNLKLSTSNSELTKLLKELEF
ncbi:hypothetical protein LCL85_14015 [Vibrio alginolyticus]|nr:hypothetical protein [Vibrio alginolyticus]